MEIWDKYWVLDVLGIARGILTINKRNWVCFPLWHIVESGCIHTHVRIYKNICIIPWRFGWCKENTTMQLTYTPKRWNDDEWICNFDKYLTYIVNIFEHLWMTKKFFGIHPPVEAMSQWWLKSGAGQLFQFWSPRMVENVWRLFFPWDWRWHIYIYI